MAKTKVELQHAWEWICEDCGRNNFSSAVVAEMPPEERLQFAKDQGMVDEFATEVPEELCWLKLQTGLHKSVSIVCSIMRPTAVASVPTASVIFTRILLSDGGTE